MKYVIAYDVGTTGVKTCLVSVGEKLRITGDAYGEYDLFVMEDGGAEQDADQWWQAMCDTTRELVSRTEISPDDIDGISFCSQMQGLVLVDREGSALRRPMSYMDQRAVKEMKECQGHGLQISGVNAGMLLRSLAVTHAASTSVKDPLWKYKWVQKNEPETFSRVYKWLDVKEYLICRCTGEFVMTRDSAYATFLYDPRKGHECWSGPLCRMYGVDPEHLPRIIECTDVAGTLTDKAASQLGLAAGTKVYGGGGDATLIGIGAGCTKPGQTHIYSGTSGWVSTVAEKQYVDISAMIAGIVGAQSGRYNYFAEMETAGKCFQWVKEHLALDEIGVYLDRTDISQSGESMYESLYDYLSDTVAEVPAGAGGVIFTPWLHGNRCPFEAPDAAGMFFNIKIGTGKKQMIRAVLEGICYHLRWMLECEDRKLKTSDTIRFAGGGALSDVTCQMLADITGRTIETVHNTKDVGSLGAAVLAAVGSGAVPGFDAVDGYIDVKDRFVPDPRNKEVYDLNYRVFRNLYRSNRDNFRMLNSAAKKG
ncbi:MAG: FGGY-family carbohydrate kinase [Clostridiales bacterium]|nr:FGGY-family carbohydrate kinase [Clostridiales bacterium]